MQRINKSLEELNNFNEKNSQQLQRDQSKERLLKNTIEQQLLIQDKNIKESREKDLTTALREKWEAYKKKTEPTPPNTLNNNSVQVDYLYKSIKELTYDIMDLNQDGLIRKRDNLSKFLSTFLIFITLGSIISLIFGFFMSWFFTGLFLNPLNKMTEILSRLGREEKTIFLHIKGSDEIERLCNEFNLMTSRLEEYHQGSLGQIMKDYQTLKMALDNFPDPIILLDSHTNIMYINKIALQLFGFANDFKKTPSLFLVEEKLREVLIQILNKVLLTKNAYAPEKAEEAIPIYKENKKIFFLPWAYPIKKATGNGYQGLEGVIIILQNLMRQPLSEMSKTAGYETLIHEFQSPLTEIHMAIHLCLQEAAGPITERQQEILFSAREKCDYLEKLCQDLLHLSGITQKSQSLEQEEIDLNKVISKTITALQLEASQKGIFINFEEPPYLSKIKTDISQIKIVIGNLLRNAIHYADSGTIVKIKLSEKNNFVELSINDKGLLIPIEYHKNIFKKHFKIPGQSQKRAGLGLYIAKKIIQILGGKIGFKSSEKLGTTFWITIPISMEKS